MNPILARAPHFAAVLNLHADSRPEAEAIRHLQADGEAPQVTRYGELRQRAQAIAAYLQETCGELAGERCLLMLPSGADYAAAFFACFYAGAIAVPAFPPEHNRQLHLERLAGILRDARPRVLLALRADLLRCQAQLLPLLPAGSRLIALEDVANEWAERLRPVNLHGHDLAFLQYTSGSTSAPKGVMVSHANLMANERAMASSFGAREDEVWVNWLPLYHDMGLMAGLLLPILHGHSLELMAPNFFLARPQRWLEAISRCGGTFSGGPDFAFRLCTERVRDEALQGLRLDSWRLAFSGSEPIRRETLEAFAARFAPCGFERRALRPSYGLAEATLFVTTQAVDDEFHSRRFADASLAQPLELVSCGCSAAEHPLRLVDPHSLEPLGEGRVGEIWIAGPSIAQGYWQNPEASAASFVERDGQRWLRSGDLGIVEDGELYVAGRLKDLIILNGQNLYPQDIEQLLENALELLRKGRVAAFAVAGEDGGEAIGLAMEISRNVRRLMKPQAICTAIAETLGEALQLAPQLILLLEPGALPRTTSGKLQRSACLPAWRAGTLECFAVWRAGRLRGEEGGTGSAAPLTDVAAAWAEALGRSELAGEDNFFALGGDSVRAMQVLARLNAERGIELTPEDLFEHPRLADFCERVAAAPAASGVPLQALDEQGERPQSFAQQRLWFLDRLESDSRAYHLCGEWRFSGRLDEAALQHSLDALAARHPSLRTLFAEGADGQPVQRVLPAAPVALLRADLADQAQAEAELARLADALLAQPMDLRQGPLWRVQLVRLGPDEARLLLVMHHIIADGWSAQVLLEDFAELYRARIEGRAPSLRQLPVQYADFARWQRQRLAAGEAERQLAYWRAQLGDEQPLLELPGDRPRPARQSHRGARHGFRFDAELSQRLRVLARERGVTLFMLMLALFKTQLYRYSGQRDLRVGVPVAGRTRAETEGLVGFFVNTLVLRSQPAARRTFAELLAEVKDAALGAQAHQELPFEQLVEALQPERSLAHNPLCQVKFTQQFVLPQALELPQLRLGMHQLDDHAAHFDLGLDITDDGEAIEALFTYACDLFDAPRIVAMGEELINLAEQVSAEPERALGELRLLAAPAQLDGEALQFPARDVLALWYAQAAQNPAQPVLQYESESYQRAWLEAESNRLARQLHSLGLGEQACVGLLLERSPRFVVALLASLKAGAAFVPLDPKWPAERQAFVLADCAAAVLIGEAPLAGFSGTQLDFAADAAWRAQPAEPLQLSLNPQQAAYLIYTSGTSGQPKGVVIEHAALADYVQGLLARLQLAPQASMAMVSTVAADLGHTVLFGALCSGRTLHLIDAERAMDAEGFAQYMATHRVDVLKIVPTHLAGLLQAAEAQRVLPEQALILGGETLPGELLAQVRRLKPGCRVINHYGPTEATVGVLTCESQGESRAVVPIGKPLANAHVRICNDELLPLPQGAAGELLLGGPGLARGYHQRAEQTAAAFVTDPQGSAVRLYRSGDRARLLADGRIEFLGRGDDQVKVRGYRVALGEVAQRLRALDGVIDAHVQLDERGQLLAWARVTTLGEGQGEALKAALAERLPDYMVPAQVLALESFPLTANGKLDRRALPQPSAPATTYEAPREGAERILAELWQQLLQVERVGRHDNFFALGGDSIISLQVIARARRQGVRLTPKQLFEKQTIAELAQVAQVAESAPAAVAVAPAAAPRDIPLTPIQKRFMALAPARRGHWNQALLLTPRTRLDGERLRTAIKLLLERHGVLRLSFEQGEDGRWQQRYRAVEDAGRVLWTCRVARAEDLPSLYDEAQRSLDIEQGPLLRVLLAELDDGRQRLLLAIHHLAVDGVSWRVLLDELQRLYAGASAAELGDAGAAWHEWAQYLHTRAASAEVAAQLPYWQAQCAVAAELPCSNAQGSARVGDGARLSLTLDAEQTRRLLVQAPAAFRTQINDLLLAALAQALWQWSGRRCTRISLEGHGRETDAAAPDVSRTLGWFTSLYPLVLEAEEDVIATLKATKERLRGVPDKGLGFGLLHHLAGAEGLQDADGRGLTFNYLGRFESPEDAAFVLADEEPGGTRSDDGPLANALAIDGQVRDGSLRLDWTYSRARFTEEEVQRLMTLYREALECLIERCCDVHEGGLTPADVPLAGLDQAQLDALPTPRLIEDVLPLAPMQEGILLHSLLEQGSGIYLMQDHYEVRSEVDFDAFQYAWQQVVRRHPMLRTCFHGLEGGVQRQLVLRQVPSPAQFIDLAGLPRDEAEAELQALLRAEREEGFDFARAPLLRLRLVRFGAADYRIVQSHHHALIDAWCRGLMLAEFFAHYRARLAGQTLALPPARPYRDFIAWLAQQDEQAGRRYWRPALAGFSEVTPLPYRRSPVGAEGIRDLGLALGQAATARLAETARQHQLTVNTFVQAAWGLLLMRHAGLDEAVFGVTVAGRPTELEGIEETLGLFINTLPLRLRQPAPGSSGLQLLNELQAQNAAMRDHEHLSLAEVQALADTPRGQPLFDSLFVFENVPLGAEVQAAVREYRIRPLANRTHTNYPLTVVVLPGESLQLQLSFDGRLFRDSDMQALLEQFQRVLLQLAEAPQRPLAELPLLAAQERRELLQLGRGNVQPHWYAISYLQRFESWAANAPQRVVASCQGESLSYAELNRRANRLGHGLIAAGIQADQVVALYAPRGLPLLAMMLGAFKAGAAYLALDERHPPARSARMLGSSAAPLLITPRACLAQVEAILAEAAQAPRVLVYEELLEGVAEDNPGRYAGPEQLAYVIYTSGSTGEPKGVMVNQRGMLNNQLSKLPYLRLGENDVIAQTAATGFDISVWQFLTAPLFGGRVEIIPDAITHDPQRLLEQVASSGVSVLECVPAVIDGMLACTPQALPGLRWLLPTGEALGRELVQRWFARYPQIPLVNAYGPAECADDVALHSLLQAGDAAAGVPIGQPTDNNRLYVLDANLELLPRGVTGELYIGGSGVGRGYAGRPGLSAERFLPDPFGAPGERLYRSGDLARWNEAGQLEYIGRADFQVKIRGQRIELGEIESCLLACVGVRQALVAAQPGTHGAQLVGYLVAEQGASLDLDAIRARLAVELPAYMLPSHLLCLEQLPRNANGKLDRRALPLPDWQERPYQAPQGECEKQLAALWRELLKVERVGRDEHFFELGGHSLLATRMLSLVHQRLGVRVPLAQAFEASTVASLAALIERLRPTTLSDDRLDALDALMDELEENE